MHKKLWKDRLSKRSILVVLQDNSDFVHSSGLRRNFVFDENVLTQIRNKHDFSYESGERQTSADILNIRADHRFRYEFACKHINKVCQSDTLFGADIFCGNGYGSKIISESTNCKNLLSVDGSSGAIEFAKINYSNSNIIDYRHLEFPFSLKRNFFDFIVSLESVEHVANDDLFIRTLWHALKHQGVFILSTPDEEYMPYEINPNEFHYRHYYFDFLLKKMELLDFRLIEYAGQNVYKMDKNKKIRGVLEESEMSLHLNERGQFNICAFILEL